MVCRFLLNAEATVIAIHSGSKNSIKILGTLGNTSSNIEGLEIDVTEEESIKSGFTGVMKQHGRVDILCNLVGEVGEKRFIEDIPLHEWNTMMTVNLQSCFLMMKHVIPSMKKNGFGRIINIAAMPGVTPEAMRGGYGVAKAGVVALTKTVAEEIKEYGDITVNAIAPSIIVTEENKRWGTESEIKKWVTPDQIAEMIVHLCTDPGVAINGQVINMYGKV